MAYEGFDLDRDAIEEVPDGVDIPAEAVVAETPTEDPTACRLREAAEWKDKGNQLYLIKDFLGALEMYDTALEGTVHTTVVVDRSGLSLVASPWRMAPLKISSLYLAQGYQGYLM
jgi:hypothetical protein